MSKSCSGSGMLVYNGRDSKCLVKACWPSAVRCYIYICVYIYLTCFKTSAYLGVILNSKIPCLLALDVFRAQWGDWGFEFKILRRGYFFVCLSYFCSFTPGCILSATPLPLHFLTIVRKNKVANSSINIHSH